MNFINYGKKNLRTKSRETFKLFILTTAYTWLLFQEGYELGIKTSFPLHLDAMALLQWNNMVF